MACTVNCVIGKLHIRGVAIINEDRIINYAPSMRRRVVLTMVRPAYGSVAAGNQPVITSEDYRMPY